VLKDLHKALDIPWFDGYDLNNVENPPGIDLFDAFMGTPTLHQVKPVVKAYLSRPVTPAALASKLPPPFWINESVTPNQ
jgi:hypothetical protein